MWIKICGIRDVATAKQAVACGVDAVGLNFYAQSPRVVELPVAVEIVEGLPEGVEPVGVFVNHSAKEIRWTADEIQLETIQLHGDEPPELVAELAEFRIIRAFRVGVDGLGGVREYLAACEKLGAAPWACLIDARVEGVYGGTGQVAPWDVIQPDYNFKKWPPLILAGGLRPENIAEAIRTVGPWGVDTAGGVESSVACKDAALVRQFVENARGASTAKND